MARHIVAVCVVCLLCADRIPCEQHIDDNRNGNGIYPAGVEHQALNAKVFRRLDPAPNEREMRFAARDDDDELSSSSSSSTENLFSNHRHHHKSNTNFKQHAQHRRKRHTGHSHGEPATLNQRPEITQDFLHRIFDEYGHGDGTLSIIEFRTMLNQLGLHQMVQQKFSSNLDERNNTGNCVADSDLVQHVQMHEHDANHAHNNDDDEDNDHALKTVVSNDNFNCSKTANAKGMNSSTICSEGIHAAEYHEKGDEGARAGARVLTTHPHNYSLSEEDILNICPVLLYQLASPLDSKRSGCIVNSILVEIDERAHSKLNAGKEDIVYVWIYAFFSVFACGILGLVGVAIIPFMDSRYYKHIIQYLVSLAVGTMTGDALLHLLPHSLAGQSESGMIYKGLTCMGGIIFFYITEHGLTMISEWRKRKAKKETKKPSRAKVVRDPDSSITNSAAGDKLCKSKYSSYPYCYDEIAMDSKTDVWLHLPNNTTETHDVTIAGSGAERKRNGKAEAKANESMAAQSLLSTSQNHYAPMTDMNNHHHHHHHHLHHQQQHDDHQQQLPNQHQNHHQNLFEDSTATTDLDHHSLGDGSIIANAAGNGGGAGGAASGGSGNGNNTGTNAKDKHSNDTVTVILREHESSHHGHSHKHGHVHSPPESLSAVAWMIIMGDGLHNFTDGMAIGAAFADNIAGGFSTSLAVFCHELPHELGDFAILMKAGMSVKSAVFYNLLTGVLSFIGMIFGIVFGQSQQAAQWMFAAAAGLFIYIALVDMMPELSSAHKSLEQLALQIFGMSTGVFLMLLIAIYEGDLMNIFSSSPSGAVASSPVASASGH